jgi:ABC-2 type transport system ATP-binding protein
MKKKTALAMALLPNPRALFLDEPFEGIDPVTAETIRVVPASRPESCSAAACKNHRSELLLRLTAFDGHKPPS